MENREQEVSKVAEQEVEKGKRWSGRKFNNRNQMPKDRGTKCLCSAAQRDGYCSQLTCQKELGGKGV